MTHQENIEALNKQISGLYDTVRDKKSKIELFERYILEDTVDMKEVISSKREFYLRGSKLENVVQIGSPYLLKSCVRIGKGEINELKIKAPPIANAFYSVNSFFSHEASWGGFAPSSYYDFIIQYLKISEE